MDTLKDKLAKLHTRRPGKGNLKRETESLLIAAQNDATKTNYNKAEIDNM